MSELPQNAIDCAIAARTFLATVAEMAPSKAKDLRELIDWLNALMGLDGEGR